MTRYAIDAPTLLRLIAEGVKVGPEHQIVAPNLIRSEALSLLFDSERITELKMRLLGDRVSRRTAWRIATEQGWASTREAEYVAITKLQADALVTVDPALAKKAGGLVPLATFHALTTS